VIYIYRGMILFYKYSIEIFDTRGTKWKRN